MIEAYIFLLIVFLALEIWFLVWFINSMNDIRRNSEDCKKTEWLTHQKLIKMTKMLEDKLEQTNNLLSNMQSQNQKNDFSEETTDNKSSGV